MVQRVRVRIRVIFNSGDIIVDGEAVFDGNYAGVSNTCDGPGRWFCVYPSNMFLSSFYATPRRAEINLGFDFDAQAEQMTTKCFMTTPVSLCFYHCFLSFVIDYFFLYCTRQTTIR